MTDMYNIREIPALFNKYLKDTWTVKFNMGYFEKFPSMKHLYPLMIAKDFTDVSVDPNIVIKFKKCKNPTDKKSLSNLSELETRDEMLYGLKVFDDYFHALSDNATYIQTNYNKYLVDPEFNKFINVYKDFLDDGYFTHEPKITTEKLMELAGEYFDSFNSPYPMYLLVHSLLSYSSNIFVHKDSETEKKDTPYFILFSSTNMISYSYFENDLRIDEFLTSDIQMPYSIIIGSYSYDDIRNWVLKQIDELIGNLLNLKTRIYQMPSWVFYHIHDAFTEVFPKQGSEINVSVEK
jgi:hypothetical protein